MMMPCGEGVFAPDGCLMSVDIGTFDEIQAALIAAENNIPFASVVDLYDNAAFLEVVEARRLERNCLPARYETIKKIAILKHDFSRQTEELTATLKVKRKAVQEIHKMLIDSMYDDAPTKTIIV